MRNKLCFKLELLFFSMCYFMKILHFQLLYFLSYSLVLAIVLFYAHWRLVF